MLSLAYVLVLLPGLVIGITVHEAAHALTAKWLGDYLPKRLGRISLNPFKHLSLWGTLALFVLGFGWGKPVPVNLYNFKRTKLDYLLCSLAGPVSNLLVCVVIGGLLLLLKPGKLIEAILIPIFLINAVLAVINFLPIPPLDGSKIWPCVIPGMRPVISGKWSTVWVVVLIIGLYSGAIGKIILPTMNRVGHVLTGILHDSPRPAGFPEVLNAPQGAYLKNHYVSTKEGNDPNVFGLFFKIAEPYPAKQLIGYIEENLTKYQYYPLAYQLSDPNKPAEPRWQLEAIGNHNFGSWKKGWINRQGELIVVNIKYEPKDGSEYSSQRAIVYFILYKSIPESGHLAEYRSKHPEEFKSSP